jgi:two-component system phosphate regulon sensor histidine kinase PhoR
VKARLATGVSRRIVVGLALVLSLSMAVLGALGYRASREWRHSATVLAGRRAQEAADLLVTALVRDMRSVQAKVLSSRDWDELMLDPPYDISQLVASAFARYAYPEAFFAWRSGTSADDLMFFGRADRPPAWIPPSFEADAFPVMIAAEPAVARRLLERVAADAGLEARFSVFALRIGDSDYQVVARLQYGDAYRVNLTSVFGFLVNMDWVEQRYLHEFAGEVQRATQSGSDVALTIVKRPAAAASSPADSGPSGARPFSVMFFDPLVMALSASPELPAETWTARAVVLDQSMRATMVNTQRTLVVAVVTGLMFSAGLAVTLRLVRANTEMARARADFVSSATHELKTPVAVIRAAADTLMSGRLTGATSNHEYVQLVADQAKHLARLLDTLLAYARISEVTDAYTFEAIAVKGAIDETLRDFKWQLESAHFEVVIDIPAGLPPVRADRVALGLVLDNLVENAIGYSREKHSLRIGARVSRRSVEIAVEDCGVGIAPHEVGLVTRRFYRGRQSAPGGSGLGLAIVERIVSDHLGTLVVESAVNSGTTVRVSLPIA